MLSGLNSNLKFANNNPVAATCDEEDKATRMGGLLVFFNKPNKPPMLKKTQ